MKQRELALDGEPVPRVEFWVSRKVEPNSEGVPEMVMQHCATVLDYVPTESDIQELRKQFFVKPDEEIELR